VYPPLNAAHTTDALILRTYKLGESDRIVVFLTRDRGKKRGVAKNARQSRRRFGGALEPMTCGRVGYVERERRELVRCDSRADASPLSAIDGRRSYVGVLRELIDEWAQARSERGAVSARRVDVDAMAAGVPSNAGAVLRVLAAGGCRACTSRRSGCRRAARF
jgi:DNA repair protein RecO (recombination protein O)